jgi:hypothetical protein
LITKYTGLKGGKSKRLEGRVEVGWRRYGIEYDKNRIIFEGI